MSPPSGNAGHAVTASPAAAPPPSSFSSAADWGLQAAQAMLRRMLDSADDVLFELSGRTMAETERRGYFDAMRLLRRSGAELARSFEMALRPDGAAKPSRVLDFSAKTLSLRGDDEVESEIMMSRTVSRVESAAQNGLWELGLRLENLRPASALRSRLERLRPQALATAFRDALEPLQLSPEVRLILFKLLERQLLADANPFYETLNNRLEQEGVSSETVAVRRRDRGATGGTGSPNAPAGKAPPAYSLPSSLVSSLSQWGVPGSAWSATAESGSPYTGGAPQRLSLVNQLLEETGSRWPREDLEALRRLILPIIQIALSDASFFADGEHPARRLIAGLETLAAEPGDERSALLAQTESALQTLQQQHSAPTTITPLSDADLQLFLSSQRSPRSSTSARMASAKASAHEQIKTVGSGYDLPVGLSSFLGEVWMPMVSAQSLRFGVGSPEWARSAELLKRLFGECRWLTGGSGDAALISTILDDVSTEMRQLGVPDTLITRACTLLRSGLGQEAQVTQSLDLDTLGARPASETKRSGPSARDKTAAATAGQLVDWRAGLPVGSWFRVFDRQTDRTLWMTADVFYPEASQLSFTGFDTNVRVSVIKADFLDDLRTGRAEPVNATPAQSEAIARLLTTTPVKAAA